MQILNFQKFWDIEEAKLTETDDNEEAKEQIFCSACVLLVMVNDLNKNHKQYYHLVTSQAFGNVWVISFFLKWFS